MKRFSIGCLFIVLLAAAVVMSEGCSVQIGPDSIWPRLPSIWPNHNRRPRPQPFRPHRPEPHHDRRRMDPPPAAKTAAKRCEPSCPHGFVCGCQQGKACNHNGEPCQTPNA